MNGGDIMIGIYKFTNKITGKSYIGQSKNIQKRYNAHKSKCNDTNKEKENTYFHRMLEKYGFDNFTFEILEECEEADLDSREIYYIDKLKTLYPNGYNVSRGANLPTPHSMKSLKAVDEVRKLLKTTTLTNIEIGSMYNVSDQLISDINAGRVWYDDTINYPIRKYAHDKYYCKICGKQLWAKCRTGMCTDCFNKERRKHIPKKDVLFQLLKENSVKDVATMYSVTDETVRKWKKYYTS